MRRLSPMKAHVIGSLVGAVLLLAACFVLTIVLLHLAPAHPVTPY